MAQPLIEVVSVTIFPKSLPCEVYGTILVYDEDDPEDTYSLYEQDVEHPEIIAEIGQVLLLTGQEAMYIMKKPVMDISLKDKAHKHALIASGNVNFDHTTSNDYEEFKFAELKGEHGHIRVSYIAIPCGVVAEITILVSKHGNPPPIDGDKILAFGSVVAQYRNTYLLHEEYMPITLLKVPSNESIPLFFGTDLIGKRACLNLTRHLVAVSAHASLVVESNLTDKSTNEPFFSGTTERMASRCFRTWSAVYSKRNVSIKPDKASVFLRWHDPFELRQLWCSNRLEHMDISSYGGFEDSAYLLEVFSVFIGRENDVDLSITGNICIEHEHGKLVIFDRDDTNPDRLLNGSKLLSIPGPTEFMPTMEYFIMSVELKDVDNKFSVEEGILDFDGNIAFKPELEYDRLLCAVIQGEGGYCAVHYTHFSGAVGIEVKCVLLCKGIDVASVCGSVVAWSDMFDYTSDYNKKYYRKYLYDKPQSDFVRKSVPKKTEDSSSYDNRVIEVKLFKSCLAMPDASTMFFDVDLHASSHLDGRLSTHLKKTLEYKLGDKSPVEFEVGDYEIALDVVQRSRPYYG